MSRARKDSFTFKPYSTGYIYTTYAILLTYYLLTTTTEDHVSGSCYTKTLQT
jgi:hypothetical protein